MTSEKKPSLLLNRGDVVKSIVLVSPTGWETIFEKWESGIVTRKFVAPRRNMYKPSLQVLNEDGRYEFDWEKGIVMDKTKE